MALTAGPVPLYYQLAEALRGQIVAGELRPGDVLRVTGRASPHGYAVTLLRDGTELTSGRLAVPAIAAQGDALRRVEAVHG